jgi:hypothetical protein
VLQDGYIEHNLSRLHDAANGGHVAIHRSEYDGQWWTCEYIEHNLSRLHDAANGGHVAISMDILASLYGLRG